MSIAVFGSINCDVVAYLDRLPKPGETLHGSGYKIGLGGKGANQAVAARRLGSTVSFIARTGGDMFGEACLKEIAGYDVATDLIKRDAGGATGIAIINVAANGENTISLIGDANMRMDESDVARAGAALDKARVLLLQLEVPFAASLAAARRVRGHDGTVILDPAPAPAALFSAAELEHIDLLTPNETETARLVGWQPATPEEGLKAARELRGKGVRGAIVKLGGKGVAVSAPDFEGLIPPFRVTPIDTVAAGDCFNGGLAHALATGRTLADAVRYASACGALSTTKRGAAAAAPTAAEVEAFIKNQ
ncbi:MAG: ribokinase [Rhizobiales bacterium]|nr:ribokinase [Hyphomicrobiales bacterium]